MNADKTERILREMVAGKYETSNTPEIRYIKIPTISEDLKRVYFNAGRASAGARDITARKAFAEMQKLESGRCR